MKYVFRNPETFILTRGNESIDVEELYNKMSELEILIPFIEYIEESYLLEHPELRYICFEAIESGTFEFSEDGLYYSTDNCNTWSSLPSETPTPTVNTGEKIYFKGELTPAATVGIGTFSATGQFNAIGNTLSLLFGDNAYKQTSLSGKNNAFRRLFKGCTTLINAGGLKLNATTLSARCYTEMFQECGNLLTVPKLPATTLSNYCYNYMFEGCTSITMPPELPATTLGNGCYGSMFSGCTSLTEAPELPATSLTNSCYSGMFIGCTSITEAPELQSRALATSCYANMFSGCTGLTTPPRLPARTIAASCYQAMFEGCSNLTNVPVLHATELFDYCYAMMFKDCASITTAPFLGALTLAEGCYSNMFNGCTNLNYVKAMFTTTPGLMYTSQWLSDVSPSGTFVKNSAAEWESAGDATTIPAGWTVITESV